MLNWKPLSGNYILHLYKLSVYLYTEPRLSVQMNAYINSYKQKGKYEFVC